MNQRQGCVGGGAGSAGGRCSGLVGLTGDREHCSELQEEPDLFWAFALASYYVHKLWF